MEMRNGATVRDIPHFLTGKEVSWEELQDNLHLRYRLIHQGIPATCNGYSKKVLIEHALSCPKVSLVVVRHDNNSKE